MHKHHPFRRLIGITRNGFYQEGHTSMNTISSRWAATLGLAALGVLAVPAGAALADVAPAAATRACVADATGTAPMRCFATFDEALKASGAQLTQGSKNTQSASDPAATERAGVAAAATYVLSIDYTGSNYTGNALIWTGPSPCTTRTTDVDYQIPSMPAGWDNVISSYKTYANCWGKDWENTNYTGASVGYNGSRSYIGAALDNRTSSEQWS